MSCKYNIVSELFRRENGLSNRSNTFERNILGSPFIAEKMKVKDLLQQTMFSNPGEVAFNHTGDLLCTANNVIFYVYDWNHNKKIHCFYSKHKISPYYLKFINTDNSSLDVISASEDGEIHRTRICPMGEVTSTVLYRSTYAKPRLTKVPSNPDEFIGATSKGHIFSMDLRCSDSIQSINKYVSKKTNRPLGIFDMAHHPFSSEFCIAGDDKFVRIFDKRNLSECVQKMYPKHPHHLRSENKIYKCSYSYNGDDIQALYYEVGVYLFNSRNYTPGKYLSCYRASKDVLDQSEFFGPKSEFMLLTEGHRLGFYHRNSGKVIKRECIYPGKNSTNPAFVTGVKPHPFLPVIASKTWNNGVLIWSTTP